MPSLAMPDRVARYGPKLGAVEPADIDVWLGSLTQNADVGGAWGGCSSKRSAHSRRPEVRSGGRAKMSENTRYKL